MLASIAGADIRPLGLSEQELRDAVASCWIKYWNKVIGPEALAEARPTGRPSFCEESQVSGGERPALEGPSKKRLTYRICEKETRYRASG